jgi:hypothetical protein
MKSLQLLIKAARRGEGSRGGIVIGHTSGGKPIYASSYGVGRQRHKHFRTGDHIDAQMLHMELRSKHKKHAARAHAKGDHDKAERHVLAAFYHHKQLEEHSHQKLEKIGRTEAFESVPFAASPDPKAIPEPERASPDPYMPGPEESSPEEARNAVEMGKLLSQ